MISLTGLICSLVSAHIPDLFCIRWPYLLWGLRCCDLRVFTCLSHYSWLARANIQYPEGNSSLINVSACVLRNVPWRDILRFNECKIKSCEQLMSIEKMKVCIQANGQIGFVANEAHAHALMVNLVVKTALQCSAYHDGEKMKERVYSQPSLCQHIPFRSPKRQQ